MEEAGLEDGAKRAFDGEWRVHYGGYWVKAYDAPADSLQAKKSLIQALTRRLFNHVEHGLNIPGHRLGEARQAFESERDLPRRRVKGAMLAGALFNRAADNAGVNIKNREFRQLTPETWQKVLCANLDGAFYCIHYVLPQMIERRDGVVINIDSVSGKRSHPLGGVAYNASKFGMTALGLCLGAEEKENGIRVCNIYPGEVDTPILKDRPTEPTAEHRQRMLRSEDVAAAVLFVATLPPHVTVPELIIKPADALYV